MKILLVNSLYYPHVIGGAERSVQLLVESLRDLGDEVTVLTTAEEASEGVVNGVPVHYLRVPNIYWMPNAAKQPRYRKLIWHVLDSKNPTATKDIRSVLERVKPDLVHTNNLAGLSVSVWSAARKLGIPVVHTVRDHYLMCIRGFMFHRGVQCARQCGLCRMISMPRKGVSTKINAAVGVSRFILDKHLDGGFFRNVPIQTHIHSSVPDLPTGQPHKVTGREVVFGFVGQFTLGKGIEYLLRNFSRIPVGGGRLRVFGKSLDPAYNLRLREVFAGPSIEFMGHRPLEEIYSQVDVVVVPSLGDDAFPRAVIEAFAYGRPVIATMRGGAAEVVVEGKTGYLFEPNSIDQFEDRLRRFIDKPELVADFSPHCLEQAAQLSGEAVAEKYRDIYRSVLAQHISH